MLKKTHYSYSGMKIIEHNFNVPIDYFKSNSKTINIFAREISDNQNNSKDLPFLLFLQGGPGYESPRPLIKSGWLKRALMNYKVLLLDQRGTGLSSSISSHLFNGMSDESISKYLTHFRADNIIRDAEFIRKKLINNDRWNILGQSFGGFCAVTYLSYFPDSLDKVFITGGLPPIKSHPDDVYRSTYKRVLSKNKIFYETFPNSIEKVIRIVRHLERNKEYLPNGDILSVKRFQQLGLILGFSDGMATLNYLIENSFDSNNSLSYYFLKNIYSLQSFDTNPIFSVLHEACYAQGFATEWSAERIKKEFSEFEIYSNNKFYFTGEMIYPWMFDFYSSLRPLKGASKIIARKQDWPLLYNLKNLENNNSKVVAVVYTNDMYVDREFSLDTACHISNISVWETEKYEHNGLRSDGEEILGILFEKTKK